MEQKSWNLSELKYQLECEDPLSPDWFDSLVLVSRRYVKDLVGRAITSNNKAIWDGINDLEERVSAFDDQVAALDELTNDLADDVAAVADKLGKKDQADADKLKAVVDRLRAVGESADNLAGGDPATEEPVADGEPVPDSSPQTNAAPGVSDIPVSNFPAQDADGNDVPVSDGSFTPAEGDSSEPVSNEAPASDADAGVDKPAE